jgi:hypothetical protein
MVKICIDRYEHYVHRADSDERGREVPDDLFEKFEAVEDVYWALYKELVRIVEGKQKVTEETQEVSLQAKIDYLCKLWRNNDTEQVSGVNPPPSGNQIPK